MNLIALLSSLIILSIYITSFSPVRRTNVPREITEEKIEEKLSLTNAAIISQKTSWNVGEVEEAEINISSPEVFSSEASVFTLVVNFNPQELAIEKVIKGDIWEESNLLQSDIDNQKGELVFTLGKGFNESRGGGKSNMVTIEFRIKGIGKQSTITLGNGSLYAKEGKGGLIKASPLIVALEDL